MTTLTRVTFQPWRRAWHDALYGPDGFYRRAEGPAGHFVTSAQGIPGVAEILAQAIAGVCADFGVEVVVDFACGRGEFTEILAQHVAPSTAVAGIDIVPRPPLLDPRIEWGVSPGGETLGGLELIAGRRALVLAHEWLDVVPCTIAEADESGEVREVLVNAHGDERLGARLTGEEAEWIERFAPPALALPDAGDVSLRHSPGARIEVGVSRDQAWRQLVDGVRDKADAGSIVLGIDYAVPAKSRPPFGTLTGFRNGQECVALPDGSCDITCHVNTSSLELTDPPRRQRDTLTELFGDAPLAPVPLELASSHPAEYLQRLTLRSAFAAAIAHGGLGDFQWFIHRL